MKTPKKPSYAKGGSLKPVQPGQSGLSKLPTEVRNKMGYMMGGGKLGMMYKNGGKAPIVTDPKKPTERPKVEKAVVKPKDNNSMTYQPKRITKLSESGTSVDLSVNGKKQPTMNSGELSAWLKNPENRLAYGKHREETHAANLANPKAHKALGPNPTSLRDPFKTVKTNAYSHLKPKKK